MIRSVTTLMSLLLWLPTARASGFDCSFALGKIASLDDATLTLMAEELVRSHEPNGDDRRAFEATAFVRAHSDRATPVARVNFALLRTMKLNLDANELALLATLMPDLPRNPLATLGQRARNPDFTDFVTNSIEVMRRDDYRLALVELLKRGAEASVIAKNVRAQNEVPGVKPLQPGFTTRDLKIMIKSVQKKETSITFIAKLAQAIEGVIMEIIVYGRQFPNFAEEITALRGNQLHTMVDANVIRRNATRYFTNVVRLTSPPHVLRALVNTFANVEPLPMPIGDLRRMIAREAERLADEPH